jgi:hypothetical protein
MIAGDASARSYRRNHRLPCSPLAGFLIFRRSGISTHKRPLGFRQPCLVNQIARMFSRVSSLCEDCAQYLLSN